MSQPDDRMDLQFNGWFSNDVLAENVCVIINHISLATPTTVSVNSTEGDICFNIVFKTFKQPYKRKHLRFVIQTSEF